MRFLKHWGFIIDRHFRSITLCMTWKVHTFSRNFLVRLPLIYSFKYLHCLYEAPEFVSTPAFDLNSLYVTELGKVWASKAWRWGLRGPHLKLKAWPRYIMPRAAELNRTFPKGNTYNISGVSSSGGISEEFGGKSRVLIRPYFSGSPDALDSMCPCVYLVAMALRSELTQLIVMKFASFHASLFFQVRDLYDLEAILPFWNGPDEH